MGTRGQVADSCAHDARRRHGASLMVSCGDGRLGLAACTACTWHVYDSSRVRATGSWQRQLCARRTLAPCGIWRAAELLQFRNLGIWRALLCAQCHEDLLHSDTTRDHCMSTLARAVA